MNLKQNEVFFISDDKNFSYQISVSGQTQQCERILERKDHLLIGISPFNSRFSPNYVESLIKWGASTCRKVDILLPDIENASLILQSANYPLSKALRKTRKEINRHIRTIESILLNLKDDNSEIKIYQFSSFFDNPEYLKIKKSVEENFENCKEFRKACLQMSSQAMAGKLTLDNFDQSKVKNVVHCVPYIFAEIPFYINSPILLGVETSILVYHKPWLIGENLRAKNSNIKISDKQGHGIIKTEVIIK